MGDLVFQFFQLFFELSNFYFLIFFCGDGALVQIYGDVTGRAGGPVVRPALILPGVAALVTAEGEDQLHTPSKIAIQPSPRRNRAQPGSSTGSGSFAES